MSDILAGLAATLPASPSSLSRFLALAACCFVGRCLSVLLLWETLMGVVVLVAVTWKLVRPLSSRAAKGTLQT